MTDEATPQSPPPEPSRVRLFAALAKAQAAVKPAEKDSENEHHKYKYASAETLILEAKAALAVAELAFFPFRRWFVPYPEAVAEPTKNKFGDLSAVAIGRLFVDYLLVHSSGESIIVNSSTPVIPEKGRPEDKAEATAATYDLGYNLRGILAIPRVDESEDVDKRDDREKQGRVPPPRGSSAPQQRPAPAAGPKPAPTASATPPKQSAEEKVAAFIAAFRLAILEHDTQEQRDAYLATIEEKIKFLRERASAKALELYQYAESNPPTTVTGDAVKDCTASLQKAFGMDVADADWAKTMGGEA